MEVASKADTRFVVICHLNRLGELLTMWGYGHLLVKVQDLLYVHCTCICIQTKD